MIHSLMKTSVVVLAVCAAPGLSALHAQTNPPARPAATAPAATAESPADLRVSSLIGATVTNPQNETVGSIEDIFLTKENSIKSLVLSVGGFLGMGSHYVAVEPGALTIERDGARSVKVVMNTTKDQLRAMPAFEYISTWRDASTASRSTSAPGTGAADIPRTNPMPPAEMRSPTSPTAPSNNDVTGTENPNAPQGTALGTGTSDPANAEPRTAAAEQPPLAGANSFTEAQAKERIAAEGYSDIGALTKDSEGIWRGAAVRNGTRVTVAVDYKGNVVAQ